MILASFVTHPRQAVVLCTRNRPDDLHRTLTSVGRQEGNAGRLVLVVDAGTTASQRRNAETVAAYVAGPVRHLVFPGRPSLTRQRNHGLDHLPPDVEIVHFVDDDVTLLAGYFDALTDLLDARPEVGGVGGVAVGEASPTGRPRGRGLQRLFLLDGAVPGRVLPSGRATPAQNRLHRAPLRTEWLAGFSMSYRRAVFRQHRFDPQLEGYALFEDRDFSLRVQRDWMLLVEPRARLVHHVSPANRLHAERLWRMRVVNRHRLVRRHRPHTSLPAFWWSVLGQALALAASRHTHAPAARRGLARGVATVLRQAGPTRAGIAP